MGIYGEMTFPDPYQAYELPTDIASYIFENYYKNVQPIMFPVFDEYGNYLGVNVDYGWPAQSSTTFDIMIQDLLNPASNTPRSWFDWGSPTVAQMATDATTQKEAESEASDASPRDPASPASEENAYGAFENRLFDLHTIWLPQNSEADLDLLLTAHGVARENCKFLCDFSGATEMVDWPDIWYYDYEDEISQDSNSDTAGTSDIWI